MNDKNGIIYCKTPQEFNRMDGTLVFTSPGQTVVFQEYGEPFRPAEGNWASWCIPISSEVRHRGATSEITYSFHMNLTRLCTCRKRKSDDYLTAVRPITPKLFT